MVAIWEFVVGEDWITAVGAVAALGLTALASDTGPGWLVMPVVVALALGASVWRAARPRADGPRR